MYRCSRHLHRAKGNSFTVISGELFIDAIGERDASGQRPVVTRRLGPGDSAAVYTGYHQFRTGESPCVAVEEYFLVSLSEDIERLDEGGPVE